MAYRTADHLRIQDFDFVVGIEVHRSNHPYPCPVCEALAGKYPKDFKFIGWHPQCRCYATSILKTQAEIDRDNELIMAGGEPLNESSRAVNSTPDNFNAWVKDNKDRIERAKSMPYFLRDNNGYMEQALGKAPTAEELRKQAIESARVKRHASRDGQAIQRAWSERRAIYKYGDSILNYMGGIDDVSVVSLEKAIKRGNVANIEKQAKALSKQGKEILALSRLDDPMAVARQFSKADAIAVNNAVEKQLDIWSNLTLAAQKKKLEFEIHDFLGGNMNNVQAKYKTWKVSQDAYKKRLVEVNDLIEWEDIQDKLSVAKAFKSKSKPYNNLVLSLNDAIVKKDKIASQSIIKKINEKRLALDKARIKRVKVVSKGELYDGGTPYTQNELIEKSKYENSVVETILKKGITQSNKYSLEQQTDDYFSYMEIIMQRNYKKQLSVLSNERIKEFEIITANYLSESSTNPHFIWGSDVGGVYRSMLSSRQQYCDLLESVTVDELSIITRFTNGVTFYNSYNLRNSSPYWKKVWQQKTKTLTSAEIKVMERIIQEYTDATTYITNKMQRFDGVVYRGVKDEGAKELLSQMQSAWMGDKKWRSKVAASSSHSPSVAYNFDSGNTDSLIMIIKNKTGVYIRPISEYNGEREVLLMKDRDYNILSEPRKINGKWYVELEEIP